MYFNVTDILAVLLPFEKQQTGSQSWAGAAEAVEKNSVILRSICSVHKDCFL
jgi:hypothetical protein